MESKTQTSGSAGIGSENKPTEFEKNQKRYQETISTLPHARGWRPKEVFAEFEGHWWQRPLLEGLLHAREQFIARPSDFFVCSFPKTGTTWLKALTYAIANRSRYDDVSNPLLKRNPHEFVPYVEIDFAFFPNVDVLKDKGNTLFATHIPYGSLPDTILESGCKSVYIWRDPKDTFVSMWTFFQKERSQDGPLVGLEEALDMFCRGQSMYGPYLDHVLGYWKAHRENPERILFLKYEEMRQNPFSWVKELAKFMGYGFTAEEEASGTVDKVVDLCSFETLSNLEANKGEKEREDREAVYANSAYFRKAKVGDWQNYLSSEMAARMDKIMEEKFSGTGLI